MAEVRTRVLALVAGMLVLQVGWALALPVGTGIDEVDHVQRAVSVVHGHPGPGSVQVPESAGRGDEVLVPADVVRTLGPACRNLAYVGEANCSPIRDAADGEVVVASAAARYNPVYYLVVGLPSLVLEGPSALLAMRVLSALLCSLVLGAAALLMLRWARTAWPLLALVVAFTPTLAYSGGLVAPNGLHMAAGYLVWAALLSLARLPVEDRVGRRRAWVLAALGAVLMVTTHTLGTLWLVLVVAAALVAAGATRPSSLARLVPRGERRVAAAATLATLLGVAAALAWIVLARANDPSQDQGGMQSPWWEYVFPVGVPLWPLQAIAAFPFRDEPAPLVVYAIELTLLLVLAVTAVAAARRAGDRGLLLAVALVALLSFAVPIVLSALTFEQIGLAWQGRYGMPFSGGLVLLFGLALDRHGPRVPTWVVVAVVASQGVVNTLSQLKVHDQFDGSALASSLSWWTPAPLALAVVVLVHAACCSYAVARGRSVPDDDRRPAALSRA